jgi:hypothetical protein
MSWDYQNHTLARCARAACQKFIGQHGGGRHKDTGWRYCWPCARKINEACGQTMIPFAEPPVDE